MGFDRNTIIGFSLLAVLFIGYFFYVSTNQKAAFEQQKKEQDSLAALKPKVDTAAYRADSIRRSAQLDSVAAGGFAQALQGSEQLTMLENDVLQVYLSNKGGQIHRVVLKKYKGADSLPVKMGGDSYQQFQYAINTSGGQRMETGKLFFAPSAPTTLANGGKQVVFTLNDANGTGLQHVFTLMPKDYRIGMNINVQNAAQLISGQQLNLTWQTRLHAQQQDAEYEKTQSRLVYANADGYDYENAAGGVNETIDNKLKFIGIRQQFFNATLLAPNTINSATAQVTAEADTVKTEVSLLNLAAQVNLPAGSVTSVPLQFYYGPNDYETLKAYDNDMHNIVDLGSGMFAFVKWINRWLVIPVFNLLSKLTGGPGGWTILLLTIIIRFLIAPLTYTSYLSGAKMKALRPEIDAMKARVGNDQQAASMEQMKLFREAGVNPLGGCIPALLQIPIFFALYSFFNANIDLRGVPFLWANDLSSYDSILDLPFTIPFFGSHVSLFTILACATSMIISLYSMSSTPDTGNPMMKYMPYIFPVMMLFIFNKLPSALTWYYTVSNIITLALQFVIQNYIIDHNKILAQIQANKTKPKVKSKWQERLDAMQESQKKVEEMRRKQNKK